METAGLHGYITAMLKTTGLFLILACSSTFGAEFDHPGAFPGLRESTQLIDVARDVMNEYVNHRIAASKYRIPQHLDNLPRASAIAMTIRVDGRSERVVLTGGDLVRRVIEAALKVMRSPILGDIVTPERLQECTIELEIASEQKSVITNDIVKSYIPGVTGVRVSRGRDDSYVLPSVACIEDLDAQGAMKLALSQLPRRDTQLPLRWTMFTTSHCVGFPDGEAVQLYRGKLLAAKELVRAKDMASAAREVGDFLVASLDSSGRFFIRGQDGEYNINHHLYTVYALAKLAKVTGDSRYLNAANLALSYVARLVRADGAAAFVNSSDRMSATAMIVLAIDKIGSARENSSLDSVEKDLRAKMLTFLNRGGEKVSAWAVAAAGMIDLSPTWDETASNLDEVQLAFMIRSGAYETQVRQDKSDSVLSVVENTALADEQGGFAFHGQTPITAATAMVAVALSQGRESPALGVSPHSPQCAKVIYDAQRFCYLMMYKPRENYYARGLTDLLGGVRVDPTSGRISLLSCAAAIEAFLIKP